MLPGPEDEQSQTTHFAIGANSHPELFAAGPTIDAAGNLTFTPAPNALGLAEIEVVLVDDGGTAHGGIDTSAARTLQVNITKPHPWHNIGNGLDVVWDGHVAPGDALEVINYINAFGARAVSPTPPPGGFFVDVTGDGSVAPNDALEIINHVNAFGDAEGSGFGVQGSGQADRGRGTGDMGPVEEVLLLLAMDQAGAVQGLRSKVQGQKS
jgi:hypothetical protein